jgi:nitroreductase
MVDAGYRFEHMVLEATRCGIGTCWVGGFFRESSLRTTLGLAESERVIALTPVGQGGDNSFGNRLIRAVAGSSGRKPVGELFFWQRHGAPLPAVDASLAKVIEAVRRAPSWANKQPWRFVLSEAEVLIYKHGRQMKEDKDYHVLDCGIAMAHLHLAWRALGRAGGWTLESKPVPGAPDAECIGVYRHQT